MWIKDAVIHKKKLWHDFTPLHGFIPVQMSLTGLKLFYVGSMEINQVAQYF